MAFKVKVKYRNELGDMISSREYLLSDYVGMIRTDLFRVITDVENLYYRLNDGKPKREWETSDMEDFNLVKHRLLDKAGEIERLPEILMADSETGDGTVVGTLLEVFGATK